MNGQEDREREDGRARPIDSRSIGNRFNDSEGVAAVAALLDALLDAHT